MWNGGSNNEKVIESGNNLAGSCVTRSCSWEADEIRSLQDLQVPPGHVKNSGFASYNFINVFYKCFALKVPE